MKFNLQEVGLASILTVLGAFVQIGIVIWVMSSNYTGVTNKIEAQGAKIDRVATGSRERFEKVNTALDKYQTEQKAAGERMTKVETTLGFIGNVVQRLEVRMDGVPQKQ